MAKLSVYLPPFAGDYTGACAALFGMDCLVIIVDASCCTRNYVEYDETRWRGRRKSTFSAQLRTLDAVLGDDARLIDQTLEAARELQPRCIAIVGTPVPAITGMDVAGIAYEVEAASGIPAIGVDTTGFETYERGASRVLCLLADRFAGGEAGDMPHGVFGEAAVSANASVAPSASVDGGSHAHGDAQPSALPRVNVLGATVQDFGTVEALRWLEDVVRIEGVDLEWSTAGDFTPDDVARATTARESIVVSQAGLAAARLLEQRFGVPMRVGVPAAASPAQPRDFDGLVDARPLLIVHDQVIACSLRNELRAAGFAAPLAVASFFAMDDELIEPDDFPIVDERTLISFAAEHPRFAWAGDPLLARLPGFAETPHLSLPHEAVSSTLYL